MATFDYVQLTTSHLKAGDLVEIRPLHEIFLTLDSEGRLEGIPFMPEMVPFCGQRSRVFKRADIACTRGGTRQLHSTLHLENLRCDGSAHRCCEARCLFFWKEAWLHPVFGENHGTEQDHSQSRVVSLSSDTASPSVFSGSLDRVAQSSDGKLSCQATELMRVGLRLLDPEPLPLHWVDAQKFQKWSPRLLNDCRVADLVPRESHTLGTGMMAQSALEPADQAKNSD